MRAISVVGFKKSGKTTVATQLAGAIKALGHSVSVAKFTHNERADKPGTDTSKFMDVADSVALMADGETALFWPERRYLPDLLPLMGADVLIVEGGKTLQWLPRVLVLREPAEAHDLDPGLALATFGPVEADPSLGLPAIRSIDELAALVLAKGFVLPGLDCGSCGHGDCHDLAKEIVAGRAKPEDCRAADSPITVTVNGHPLGMNPFVGKIISSSIKGMLSELKGYAPGRITISLEA